MSDFPRLDRLDAMQRAPLGTFSSLRRPSPVASQYRRQSEMYGQALRTLSRAARRGDADAAIKAIDLRNQADAEGFEMGGIGRSENKAVAIEGREQERLRRNDILQREQKALSGMLDRRAEAPRVEGTGLTPDSPKFSSNGGEWVDVSGKGGTLDRRVTNSSGKVLQRNGTPIKRF